MKLVETYSEFLTTLNESKSVGYIQSCLDEIEDLNNYFSDNSSDMSTQDVKSFYRNMGKLTDKLNSIRAEKSKIEKEIEELKSRISLLNSRRAYYSNFISENIASLKHSQYNHDARLKDNEDFYKGLIKTDAEIKKIMDQIVQLSNKLNKY